MQSISSKLSIPLNRDNLYSSAMAGGVATPPMLIVFNDKYTTIDPLWHVRHLGESTGKRDMLFQCLYL